MIIEVKRRTHVQRITYDDFEQRIREGDITATTPVRFEVVTGDAFLQAGELELFQALADPDRMRFRKNLLSPGLPIITALLVGVQLRVYLWSWQPETELWLQEAWTNWAPAVMEQAEVWRLLTYGLLHLSFTHLLFNLCFLAYTGYHLERAMGRANLLLLYFGSVFTGGLLSMSMGPDRPSLGASGGDFGLLAAAVILGWKHWDSIPVRARKYFGWALAPYLGFSILTGLRAENVDNWGHLGGLLGGAALMTFLDPEVLPARRRANQITRAIAVGLMALCLGAIALAGPRLIPLTSFSDSGWSVDRPSYWREGWTFTENRGWFSPTLRATLEVTTTVHSRPLDAKTASENLLAKIGSGGRKPVVLARELVHLTGWDGQRVRLQFDLHEEDQEVEALVLARGVYEHRVLFQSVADAATHYRPLVDRILATAAVSDPPELRAARDRAATHPRSWKPAAELGDALYRAGEPAAALRSYEKALRLSPGQPSALVGLLRTYADYQIMGSLDQAREAVVAAPHEPAVLVAAADAMEAASEYDEARALLDNAWADLPGDRQLRRARLSRGMDVAPPPPQDPERR